VSLLPPLKVRKLQETLHAKAKRAPTYRFYALYDKVYRTDVLWHAYSCCRANDGSAGVDRQTFADIEAYGVGKWLGELAEELRTKTYRPQAVRRVWIPKPDGKQRPLGIPTIKDREEKGVRNRFNTFRTSKRFLTPFLDRSMWDGLPRPSGRWTAWEARPTSRPLYQPRMRSSRDAQRSAIYRFARTDKSRSAARRG
jgi:hypothetical protein